MDRIGVRELRQHASRYLDRVKAGESLEVTERGHLVALLVPPSSAQSARDRLVSSGRLLPAARPMQLPDQAGRSTGAIATEDVLDDLRGDR